MGDADALRTRLPGIFTRRGAFLTRVFWRALVWTAITALLRTSPLSLCDGGGSVLGVLGGIHYWWPKITGASVQRTCSAAWPPCGVEGFNLSFPAVPILGYHGHAPPDNIRTLGVQVLNVLKLRRRIGDGWFGS